VRRTRARASDDLPDAAGGRVGEPPVGQAARRAGVLGLITDQRNSEPCLDERVADSADDLGWRVAQAVEDAHHARVHMIGAQAAAERVVPGQDE
jgi:hypothetical protein